MNETKLSVTPYSSTNEKAKLHKKFIEKIKKSYENGFNVKNFIPNDINLFENLKLMDEKSHETSSKYKNETPDNVFHIISNDNEGSFDVFKNVSYLKKKVHWTNKNIIFYNEEQIKQIHNAKDIEVPIDIYNFKINLGFHNLMDHKVILDQIDNIDKEKKEYLEGLKVRYTINRKIGLRITDDQILNNLNNIKKCIKTINTRPKVAIIVYGYHFQSNIVKTSVADQDRNILDFCYKFDITDLIYPIGKFYLKNDFKDVENMRTLDDLINEFVNDTSPLKAITIKKSIINIRLKVLAMYFKDYIYKELKYGKDQKTVNIMNNKIKLNHNVDVKFAIGNYELKFEESNSLNTYYQDDCCKLLVLPYLALSQMASGHRHIIDCYYSSMYTEKQIFDKFKDTIKVHYCTKWGDEAYQPEFNKEVFWYDLPNVIHWSDGMAYEFIF